MIKSRGRAAIALLAAIAVVGVATAATGSLSGKTGSKPLAKPRKPPTEVLGLRKVALSSDGTKLTLSWKANPATEQVDSYAIYAVDKGYNNLDVYRPALLQGVTKKTSFAVTLTTKEQGSKPTPFAILQGKDHGSVFWVVAHNSYAWGRNHYKTPNPDGKFTMGGEYSNLSIPYDLYLEFPCTSQGRKDEVCRIPEPSDVQGLKQGALSADGTKLTLTWSANPAKEEVERYAVYALYQDPLKGGREPGFLLGITDKTSFVAELTTSGSYTRGGAMKINQGKGRGTYFWVVAENREWWGENDAETLNPDGTASYPTGNPLNVRPNYLYIEFACTAQGKSDGACVDG